jgi:hypothetical protein
MVKQCNMFNNYSPWNYAITSFKHTLNGITYLIEINLSINLIVYIKNTLNCSMMREISLSDFQILHDIIRVYLKDTFLLKSAAPNTIFKTTSLFKSLGFYDSFNSFSAGLTAKCAGTERRWALGCRVILLPLLPQCIFHVSHQYQNMSIKNVGTDVKTTQMGRVKISSWK